MVECNVKKVLARRVFKIFSGMRTFLVERFTALTFWLLFSLFPEGHMNTNNKNRKVMNKKVTLMKRNT